VRPPQPPVPKRAAEVRAVWVSDTLILDWDKATAALARAGFNTMYVNFASGGVALYPKSAVLPSLGTDDRLAQGVPLARSRGLEVHAKLIATFMFRTSPAFQQKMIQADRVMRGPDGKPILQAGYAWLCPSQPANLDLATSAVREMLGRYPVNGLQLDYIRFCEQPCCYCGSCRAAFEKTLGKPVKKWPAEVAGGPLTGSFIAWKQSVISRWMATIAAEARRLRPGIVVSAAVFADLQRSREEKAQDWKLWIERRDVDYVCTMTYVTDPRDFETRVRNQQAVARRDRVVVGIGSWKFERPADINAQIATVRRLGAPGFALFSYDDFAARNFVPNVAAR
jgi:uncharacterized lipoprotein YddW (UPF0748 family)